MATITRGGQAGALDQIQLSQRDFREQIAALTDAVRQLSGAAAIGPGALVNDPLSAPYVLYVNPYTGSDAFVSGSYSTGGSATQRIELQRLECGYTQSRPFRTINRAIIEAGIITAKSYYQAPLGNNDLVSIVLSPGAVEPLNGSGSAVSAEWVNGKQPTDAELQAFNPSATGGILLPRGCSVVAMSSDLRKTILRPKSVPTPAEEAPDASNRRAIFKVTGTGYYWGLTFMDKVGSTSSHHLLHCFEFASQAELDEFYSKIRVAFGGPNNTGGLDPALAVTRGSEYEIVGPRPASGNQTVATDTTISASPYIFNCSIRSNYGLCGVFADGAKPTGFRSMVLAQFTGVSLQRDLNCWQKYSPNQSPQWGTYFASYADFINTDPNSVRMHPSKRSFHIRAINDAIMQEVSVFAIGQGIHHWTQSGGELTVTNSNSNFGGTAALAEGYKNSAFVADSSWNIGTLRVAIDLSEKRNNVRKIYLGVIKESVANNATTITLVADLADSSNIPGVPAMLERDGYSLPAGSYVWVENTRGADYRTQLAATAWDADNPDQIKVSAPFENEEGVSPGDTISNSLGIDIGQEWPSLAGARLYIRRLQDARTVDERRYSLRCNNTTSQARTPVRDYVLQTSPGRGSAVSTIPDTQMLVVASASSIAPDGAGVIRSASVELRRMNAPNTWSSNGFYRTGDTVRYQNKLYSCKKQNSDSSFDLNKWEEAYVHMEESFRPEDYWKNTQPAIVFDNDTDPLDETATCGYNLSTAWATDAAIQRQYRTAVDYQAVHSLLMSLGFSSANAHTILLPRLAATRERNPNGALDGIPSPSGAANGWNNWAIEFRRPSNIRLFGHAWEWAGFLNYSKALPEYQRELGPINKFTYYFTNKNGGRVYGSGFNEEGFLVTPQGLQDLATGSEISFEALGDRDIPIEEIAFPSFFDQISANKISINTELNLGSSVITGNPVWDPGVLPVVPASDTTKAGVIQLATQQEAQEFLRTDRAITPATLIQALGDAVKGVANLRLSLSGSSPVPSANQPAQGGDSTSIYLHPYNGNEIALYSLQSLRWQVVRFSGVQTYSLAGASSANTNYDIYLYNNGSTLNPSFAIEFVAWAGDTTPPTRGSQDGVIVRDGNPSRRLVGVVRTTTAGATRIDLGGTLFSADHARHPRLYLANLFNLYDARGVYFFGNGWNSVTNDWLPPPTNVYATHPRVSWVQASETLVTAFLDLYNNPMAGDNTVRDGVIAYVGVGVDGFLPPGDAFQGECQYENTTANSQWARSLSPGFHNIYYLYKQFNAGIQDENGNIISNGKSAINEHPAHGMIVTVKI